MDSLGDRMKNNYENRSRFYLTRRTPAIIRLDGKAFHTFTKQCQKPFDDHLISSMADVSLFLLSEIQGCVAAYTQSDEISLLLTDYANLQTEAWFNYNKSKMESISASLASVRFNKTCRYAANINAVFDSRSFNIPKEEVCNYFLWRMQDWKRNSLTMYCQSFFSHKQLMNKNGTDMHEMLHGIGKNWTNDLSTQQKNGTLITKSGTSHLCPEYTEIQNILQPLVEQ